MPTPFSSPVELFEFPVLAFPLELVAGFETEVGRLSANCVGVMDACGIVGTTMDWNVEIDEMREPDCSGKEDVANGCVDTPALLGTSAAAAVVDC
jgi:hypothetical protein